MKIKADELDYIEPGCYVRCLDESDRKSWRVLRIVRELVCCTEEKVFHFSRLRVIQTPNKLGVPRDV